MVIKLILLAVCAYLLGNLSTGTLVAKYIGHVDIRKTGSGNAGTTNVLRTLGWVPSLLTLVGDVLKGLLPTLVGKMLFGEAGMLVARCSPSSATTIRYSMASRAARASPRPGAPSSSSIRGSRWR